MQNQRISILHFSNEIIRAGAEEHMLMLLQTLDRSAFRLHLVCPPPLLERLRPDLPSDVEVTPLAFMNPMQAGAAFRFARVLRKWPADILHSHMFHASLVASPVGWACRVPVTVETPHVREHWRRGIKASYFIDRMVGRTVSRYIAVSRANATYLAHEKRLPAKKITVVANGSDLKRFRPDHPVPAALRESLGFSEHDPVLLVAARLEPQKGHSVLLNAMKSVCQAFPDTRLVCVGDGSLRGDLIRQTGQLGLDHAVRFVGHQSNMPDWFALSDFTALPSFYEGLPLSAIESLAAGKTVVASAVDGTSEVVIHGKTGLAVPPGEPAPLAEAICRLLQDKELRRKLANAGRQWVLDNFSQERQVRETEQLYLSAWNRFCARADRSLAPAGERTC